MSAALALALLATGCGESEQSDDLCWDEFSPPSTTGYPEAALYRGKVSMESKVSFSTGTGPSTDNSIHASFVDTTKGRTISREPSLSLGLACHLLTGSPYTECRSGYKEPCPQEYLDADKVVIEGVANGTQNLKRTSRGIFSNLTVASPLFGQPEIKARITGRSQAGYFPSYEQSLAPPDSLEIESPAPGSDKAVGLSDVTLRWKPGNGDMILVYISSTATGVKDQVRCVLVDDGCQYLPAGAFDWLTIKSGDSFNMEIIRVRGTSRSLDAKSAEVLSLASRVKLQLTR